MTDHPPDPKDDGTKVPAFTYTRVARRHGYAIGVHGSMSRDLDLIAVPWVESASSPDELLKEICEMVRPTITAHTDARLTTLFSKEPGISSTSASCRELHPHL